MHDIGVEPLALGFPGHRAGAIDKPHQIIRDRFADFDAGCGAHRMQALRGAVRYQREAAITPQARRAPALPVGCVV